MVSLSPESEWLPAVVHEVWHMTVEFYFSDRQGTIVRLISDAGNLPFGPYTSRWRSDEKIAFLFTTLSHLKPFSMRFFEETKPLRDELIEIERKLNVARASAPTREVIALERKKTSLFQKFFSRMGAATASDPRDEAKGSEPSSLELLQNTRAELLRTIEDRIPELDSTEIGWISHLVDKVRTFAYGQLTTMTVSSGGMAVTIPEIVSDTLNRRSFAQVMPTGRIELASYTIGGRSLPGTEIFFNRDNGSLVAKTFVSADRAVRLETETKDPGAIEMYKRARDRGDVTREELKTILAPHLKAARREMESAHSTLELAENVLNELRTKGSSLRVRKLLAELRKRLIQDIHVPRPRPKEA